MKKSEPPEPLTLKSLRTVDLRRLSLKSLGPGSLSAFLTSLWVLLMLLW